MPSFYYGYGTARIQPPPPMDPAAVRTTTARLKRVEAAFDKCHAPFACSGNIEWREGMGLYWRSHDDRGIS